MKLNSLHDLYVLELQDLYHAENQIIKALPKMVEESSSVELRNAFEEHLEQTKGHVRRLEEIFGMLGEKAKGEKCEGMAGIIDESKDLMNQDAAPMVKDASLIAAAQRVEHYEIAAYGTVRTYAEQLGHKDAARLLQLTLDEEGETDKKLTAIAESRINIDAVRTA